MGGISALQLENNYAFALMKMSMRDMASQAQDMIELLSDVPTTVSAPAQYNFDVWA